MSIVSLQLATLHALPPGQLRIIPPHVPPVHESGVVQKRPSSHAVPFGLGIARHAPIPSLHVPTLHMSVMPEQSRIDPPHAPSVQTSGSVQKVPSSHGVPFG
jgi:hypothetical protein